MIMLLVIATTVLTLQIALYSDHLEAVWVTAKFPQIFGIAFAMSLVIGAIFELTTVGSRVLLNVVLGRYRRPKREQRALMFLDLSGSTSLAESMGELRMHDLLTRFFFDIDEPILAYGGEVHAYVGDEVIVSWPLARRTSPAVASTAFSPSRTGSPREPTGVARIWSCATFPRRHACGPHRDQRVRRFAPTHSVLWRQHERYGAHSRTLQGCRSEPAGSADLLRHIPSGSGVCVEAFGLTPLRGRAASVEIFAVERPKPLIEASVS